MHVAACVFDAVAGSPEKGTVVVTITRGAHQKPLLTNAKSTAAAKNKIK
jgi:hypothetical protein